MRVPYFLVLMTAMTCAQAQDSISASASQIPSGQSSIVVFRPLDTLAAKSVNVYINGEYLSSLRPGSYAQVVVCPGENRIGVETSDVSNRYEGKREAGRRVSQKPDAVSYFEIDSKNGRVVAIAVDDARAAQQLSAIPNKQNFTISRVSQRPCDLK